MAFVKQVSVGASRNGTGIRCFQMARQMRGGGTRGGMVVWAEAEQGGGTVFQVQAKGNTRPNACEAREKILVWLVWLVWLVYSGSAAARDAEAGLGRLRATQWSGCSSPEAEEAVEMKVRDGQQRG